MPDNDCVFTWIGYYVASVAIGMGLPILILWLVLSPASPFTAAEPQQPTSVELEIAQ